MLGGNQMVFFEKHGLTDSTMFVHHELTDFKFPLHFHPAYEWIMVIEGSIDVTLDDDNYTVDAGEAIFVHSNQLHSISTPEASRIDILLFSSQLISDFDKAYKSRIADQPVIKVNLIPETEDLTSTYSQKGYLYTLIGQLIKSTGFTVQETSAKTNLLYQLLLYVDAHYHQHCTLKHASTEIGYDYPYLSKLFVQMTNMTFTDYLNQYRISQAVEMLKTTDATITEISEKCGYEQLRTFNRNFLKWVGQTATEYRHAFQTK